MKIAGIGSRETPDRILKLMTDIGIFCLESDIHVYSGHADGADWAFEQGAQKNCTAFLPWEKFNDHLISDANLVVIKPNEESIAITKRFHPRPQLLLDGALRLMCRNAYQVLGEDLKSPVDLVICWTKDGRASGGTGQALRIAEEYNIQIINLYFWHKQMAVKEIMREARETWQKEAEKQKI
jgi:hypothetical protein